LGFNSATSNGAQASSRQQPVNQGTPGGWSSNGSLVPPNSPYGLSPRVGQRSGSLGSVSSDTTDATADQEVGVVDICTKLSDGSEGAGSGMIVTSDGEVLTNNHVVEGSVRIKVVVVSTQQTYIATALGTDAKDDVAVLKLRHASGLRTVTLSTAGEVNAGDSVTAVGNGGGDGGWSTAAGGTVVATHRTITVHSGAVARRTSELPGSA
jgi:S1-C subfamily serine protease